MLALNIMSNPRGVSLGGRIVALDEVLGTLMAGFVTDC